MVWPLVKRARGNTGENDLCKSMLAERCAIDHPGNCRNNMRRNCSPKLHRSAACILCAACGRSRSRKFSFAGAPPKRCTVHSKTPVLFRSIPRILLENVLPPDHTSSESRPDLISRAYSPRISRSRSSPNSTTPGFRHAATNASMAASSFSGSDAAFVVPL